MQYFFLEEEKDKSLSVITLQERLNSSWSDEEKRVLMNANNKIHDSRLL